MQVYSRTIIYSFANFSQFASPRLTDLRVQGLLVLKQLLSKAAPYFARHEPEVLTTLIALRGKYDNQSQVTTAIEDISEDYMLVADPKTGIDAILDLNLPLDDPSFRVPTQSWCMSLECLAALVKASRLSNLEGQFARLGRFAVKVWLLLLCYLCMCANSGESHLTLKTRKSAGSA